MTKTTTDIDNKKFSIGIKSLIALIIFAVSCTWGVSKMIASNNFNIDSKDENLQSEINNINERIYRDSMLRDQRLKDFKFNYKQDSSNRIH